MSYSTANFNDVLASCQLDRSGELLDAKTIRRAFADADCDFGHQEHTVFDKSTTLWAFLREMLHTGTERTLKAAVADVQQLRIAKGLQPNSAATGAYSAARAKIDVRVPRSLVQSVAKNAENLVPEGMRLCGLTVSNLDGTTGSFSDTDENQAKYPQPKSQKAGLGFPMWRVVVLISAVTAMVQMVAVGPWRGKGTGEAGLFVSFFEQLREAASWIDVNKVEPEDLTARHASFSVALTSIVSAYVTLHFMSESMRDVYRNVAETNRQSVQVGNRPDRVEPRCNKRRPKAQRLMLEPREVLRERLLQGRSPTQEGDEAAERLGEV